MSDIDSGDLADVAEQISEIVFAEDSIESALQKSVSLVQRITPGATGAAITLQREGKQTIGAFSDDVSRRSDEVMRALGDASEPVALKSGLGALGIRSSLAAPIKLRDRVIGIVTVYSSEAEAFGDGELTLIQTFADRSAVALGNLVAYIDAQELAEQLHQGLETRQVIGQATGILMEREGIDADMAFGMLRQASQNNNLKLRDIAVELVRSFERGRPQP